MNNELQEVHDCCVIAYCDEDLYPADTDKAVFAAHAKAPYNHEAEITMVLSSLSMPKA